MIRINWDSCIKKIIVVINIVRPDILLIVCNKSIAVDPKKIRPYGHDTVTKFLVLAWRRDCLKRLKRSDVPDDQLIRLINRVNERPALDNVNSYDWCSMAPQKAQVCVAVEILRTPDVSIYFKACGNNHTTEALHIA